MKFAGDPNTRRSALRCAILTHAIRRRRAIITRFSRHVLTASNPRSVWRIISIGFGEIFDENVWHERTVRGSNAGAMTALAQDPALFVFKVHTKPVPRPQNDRARHLETCLLDILRTE